MPGLRQFTVEMVGTGGAAYGGTCTVQAETAVVHDGDLLFLVTDTSFDARLAMPGTKPDQVLVQAIAAQHWRRFW